MSLKDLPFLLLDGQTTGMRPTSGQLLELAWTVTSAGQEDPEIHSYLLKLAEGAVIPPRVSELTGITAEDLTDAKTFAEVSAALKKSLDPLPTPRFAVIHYAQFEKPFLLDFFAREGISALPFEILCSHGLTKRLFPDLPSQNIRGTAGYFGDPVGAMKRSAAHVRATCTIWRGLTAKLEQEGITGLNELQEWLKVKTKTTKGRYSYRLESTKRLALPDAPGVYRMIAKNGDVLYVGKATSLKSRVNSYFRGKAGRDRRKLELMAQVWDLNVTECPTALEAALLETDEIKKYNPPYNVVMKKGKRHLLFYSSDFYSVSGVQEASHPAGPFRHNNSVETLRMLSRSLSVGGPFEQVFFDFVPEDQLVRGFELFCQEQGLPPARLHKVRSLLALGLNLYRNQEEPAEETVSEENGTEAEIPTDEQGRRLYTDEEVAHRFGRLLVRAGAELSQAKRMNKMLNARITFKHKGGERVLEFRNGSQAPQTTAGSAQPWHQLGIETFDRVSVLLSELQKYEHQIENLKIVQL